MSAFHVGQDHINALLSYAIAKDVITLEQAQQWGVELNKEKVL
jgi:hypothetical protein